MVDVFFSIISAPIVLSGIWGSKEPKPIRSKAKPKDAMDSADLSDRWKLVKRHADMPWKEWMETGEIMTG